MERRVSNETEHPISYERGPTDSPLLEETIGERLRSVTQRFGDREALVVAHQHYRATYNELSEQVELAARALIAAGVHKGDRVGVWAPNRYEWVIVQFATARVGVILVTINPAYKAAELRHALNRAGVSLLFTAQRFRDADYLTIIDEVRPDCPDLCKVVVLDGEWQEFLAQGTCVDRTGVTEREASLDPSDAINIQYTSGTTGLPKGATLSHRNILNNGHFTAEVLTYTEHERVCVPVPFYHCFGMVLGNLAAMTHGACIVVPGESFDAHAVLATVDAERCTSLYGVPTMFIAQLAQPDLDTFDLTSLRTGIMAGAPCPVEVIKQVRARMHMTQITIGCGMTETAPVATQVRADEVDERSLTTVGRAHPHVDVKIIDPATGSTIPRGTTGEQCTRGYNVMLGYWNDAKATANAIDGEGWMHTGDLAVMDADGYVSIVGRIKDMIIRGGENVYPREVEEFLYTLPQIDLVEVIGVPSQRYGEEVMAWIRLRQGAKASSEDLVAACRGQIATYKIPRYWKFVDSFPMTITGKTQKYRMREIAVQELELNVAA
ncbi:MAG: AMP-binding protein [Solirubrobacterales bacterium]|nr:AMP-binding protein [Solirubrobacterales bacterium]